MSDIKKNIEQVKSKISFFKNRKNLPKIIGTIVLIAAGALLATNDKANSVFTGFMEKFGIVSAKAANIMSETE